MIKQVVVPASARQKKTDNSVQISGVTAAAGACGLIPAGSSVKVYPSSAGSATVYASCGPANDAAADIAAANFSTGLAAWDAWDNGSVTASSLGILEGAVTAVALSVSSGTWVLEVVGEA